jgi:hypothetical protein
VARRVGPEEAERIALGVDAVRVAPDVRHVSHVAHAPAELADLGDGGVEVVDGEVGDEPRSVDSDR